MFLFVFEDCFLKSDIYHLKVTNQTIWIMIITFSSSLFTISGEPLLAYWKYPIDLRRYDLECLLSVNWTPYNHYTHSINLPSQYLIFLFFLVIESILSTKSIIIVVICSSFVLSFSFQTFIMTTFLKVQ